ncbi:hypothetical protein K474DRAFT_877912 [Panus rudis PR-1116 ss-1]|nr:hypothetical protein K474DRAFT_877912 [Panus rudis PR-1116 ss-1]
MSNFTRFVPMRFSIILLFAFTLVFYHSAYARPLDLRTKDLSQSIDIADVHQSQTEPGALNTRDAIQLLRRALSQSEPSDEDLAYNYLHEQLLRRALTRPNRPRLTPLKRGEDAPFIKPLDLGDPFTADSFNRVAGNANGPNGSPAAGSTTGKSTVNGPASPTSGKPPSGTGPNAQAGAPTAPSSSASNPNTPPNGAPGNGGPLKPLTSPANSQPSSPNTPSTPNTPMSANTLGGQSPRITKGQWTQKLQSQSRLSSPISSTTTLVNKPPPAAPKTGISRLTSKVGGWFNSLRPSNWKSSKSRT